MSQIQSVVEYPDEGFAIIEDDNGKFLAFRDREEIQELPSSGTPAEMWLDMYPSVGRLLDRIY